MSNSSRKLDALFTEPAPSTVLYRSSQSTRSTVSDLIDSKRNFARQAHGVDYSAPDEESGVGSDYLEDIPETVESPPSTTGGTATKLNWKNGVLVPCLLNIWGVIMFLRLGWVVGQAGLIQGTLVILFSNVVTTITALSLSAIATNGEVKGGGAYYLISRSLGPMYGGTIGLLFFVAQSIATSMYVVGFAESLIDLYTSNDMPLLTDVYDNDVRVIGIVTSVVLLCIALIGIGWYAKTQVGLLLCLVVAMLSVFVGSFTPGIPNEVENQNAGFVGFQNDQVQFTENYQWDPFVLSAQGFFTVFSVFFPAVTGIMAGANLSGDLDDPSVAIPKGTLWAIVITLISYLLLLWMVGLTCVPCADDSNADELCADRLDEETARLWNTNSSLIPSGGLLYNKLIMSNISIFGPLVYVGVFAATLSSALASLVGAPRILQSVASDELFPWPWLKYFAKGRGPGNEPIRAYFLTFVINCGFVAIAKLDIIAPLISNFFMISYGLTNYACFAQSMSKSPSWRPSFRYYNKWLSLFGAILCIVIMGLMDVIVFIVTIVIAAFLMVYLYFLDPNVNWGSAGEARKYVQALSSMRALQAVDRTHVKTFRPQYLVMAGEPGSRPWLVKFVSMLQKGNGVLVQADVVIHEKREKAEDQSQTQTPPAPTSNNEADSAVGSEAIAEEEDETHNELAMMLTKDFETVRQRRIQGTQYLKDKSVWPVGGCPGAFSDVVSAEDVFEGFKHLVHTSGLGSMRPNTVVLGYKKDWTECSRSEVRKYESIIRVALASNFGIMIVRDDKKLFDIDCKGKAAPHHYMYDRCCRSSPATEVTTEDQNAPASTASGASSKAGSSRAIIQKPRSLAGDRIDVWWVADDGGLTMLVPYLLQQSQQFKGKKLRVLTVADYNNQESLRLQKTEFRMVHLLQKFRIDAEVTGVDANLDSLPSAGTLEVLETETKVKIDSLLAEYKKQTMRILRLAEVLKQHSTDASAVFITLPIPASGMPVKLFMAWLDMLSHEMPPTIMMRGNNENVLTFFC